MSVKIMGLIWDLDLESNKKFVLLAYADHANHEGGSIWPAVNTIVKKTGYHERSVQRITRELEELGYLVADGEGPRGTNRWRIPLSQTGDKIAPLTNETQAGDIPLGDIPLGDKIAPKLTTIKEPSTGADAPMRKPATIEEAVFAGLPVTENMLGANSEKQTQMKDAANLIDMGCPGAYQLAFAFMQARDIVIPTSKVKGQRKIVREMIEMNVRAEHVTEATKSLLEKGLTVVDLYSISKTAISLANPTPGNNGGYSQRLPEILS